MIHIGLIAAVDEQSLLGLRPTRPALSLEEAVTRRPHIPWRHSADMKHFRQTTTGHVLMMGATTYRSLERALSGRPLIVISRQPAPPGCFAEVWESDWWRALSKAWKLAEVRQCQLWIAGGADVYRLALDSGIVDEALITHVPGAHVAGPGETAVRFPDGALHAKLELSSEEPFKDEPSLRLRRWVRRPPSSSPELI